MYNVKIAIPSPLKAVLTTLLALLALAGMAASSAHAAGPSRIVFVAGKAEHCKMGACKNFDLVRSIGPHGGPGRVLAKIRSVTETSAADDGTVAVLSKIVAGGGANANAFSQVYLITPRGKRVEVFPHRLQGFNATGLGISGDGRTIALTGRFTGHYADFETDQSKVWIARSNGTGLHEIDSGPGVDEMPALSRDGKRVVFARTLHDGTKAGRKTELFSVATSGGEAVRLTENTVEDVNPVFSPDGQSIAFGEFNGSNRGAIDLIRADGSAQRTVTSTGREYPDPDYSPNGRNLTFIADAPNPHLSAIYTVRANGTARSLVPSSFEFPELPQWTVRP
jgi:Tol biopolymer transport system component